MVPGKGGNMTTLKYKNRELILKVLKNSGAVSRADIAQILGLTPAAITILVNEMVREGIIRETGQLEETDRRSGRKKVLIDLNYNFKYVIGINIESDFINIGVSNLKGEIAVHKRMYTDKSLPPRKLLEGIAHEAMGLLWKENILKEHILGVGVGIVGKVDEVRGISTRAYGLWKEAVDVRGILEESLGIRTVVDNNVRTLALGDIDSRTGEDAENILFIKYGPGVGVAVIIQNQLYYGSNRAAGEIGHTVVEFGGEICRCGKRGCLETVVAENVILQKLCQEFGQEKTPVLYEICCGDSRKISLENACTAAEEGDAPVLALLRKTVTYLALAIANAVSLYDPDRVILYGKAFEHRLILQEFGKVILETVMQDRREDFITISELNHKSNYIGGIALALREFFYNKGGA